MMYARNVLDEELATMPMTPRHSHARAELARDGVTIVRSVLDERWLAHLQEALEQAIARPSPLGQDLSLAGGHFYSDLFLSASFPAFLEFSLHSGLGRRGAEWMGVDQAILFTDELLVKEPGTEHDTPWHADASYWPLAGEAMVSIWVPLDPVDAANGALHFVRGSHRWGARLQPRDFATGIDRKTRADEVPLAEPELGPDSRDLLIAEANPGDCVVFDARTVHRAGGNLESRTRRRAVVLRVVGPEVRYDPRPRTLPLIWAPRLAPGDRLRGELFPTLWRRPSAR